MKIPWADRQLSLLPLADTMLLANRFQLSAYRRSDGHRLWQSKTPPGNSLRAQEWPLVPMRPLVVGQRIVTRMLYDQGPQLVCLNRENGEIHWSVASTRHRQVVSDPLWLRNELLVVIWDQTRDSGGQFSLARYDLQTGELLQAQPLVSLHDSWFERRVCEVAPLTDGILVAAGGLLLKATAQGEVAWIRRQPLTPPEEHAEWAFQYWQRPLVEEHTAYVVQPGVMALEAVNTRTGRLLWNAAMTDLQRMLGVVGESLLVQRAGKVVALDRHTGELLWSTPLELPLLHGYLLDEQHLLLTAQQVPADPNREIHPVFIWLEASSGHPLATTVVRELKHKEPQLGPLVTGPEGRIWAFFGRGSHEANREIWELRPDQPLPILPPPLPPPERVWTERVDLLLKEAIAEVGPGWSLWHSHYDSRGDLGYRAEDRGRHNLAAVMLTEESPLVLARQVSFSKRSRPKVRLVVGAEPGRHWTIQTTVAGKQQELLTVTQSEYGDYWKTIELDLTSYAGTSGWLTLELKAANGTNFPLMIERLELVQ